VKLSKINIEIDKTESEITVIAKIKEQCVRRNKEIVTHDTADIIAKLTEDGICVGDCIQESRLCNTRPQTCIGIWVFENPKLNQPEKTVEKKSYKRKKTRKTEISLDKSTQDVIIGEEETKDNLNIE